jgi:hypothetical protein
MNRYVLGLSLILSGLIFLAPTRVLAASNTITIASRIGNNVENYPFQFGRPFIRGEIHDYPQILIDGAPVTTQADVKNRFPDGSVAFAIISIVVRTIPANGRITLSFRNQSSGHNTPLTQAQMLDPKFDFDAQMQLSFTSGIATSASARRMLQDGHYTLWTSGQIAQTVELADDGASASYDLGNGDGYHPFRPRFYATFWPSTRQVTVRYVGENGKSTELEDLAYTLTLTLGKTSPRNVYSIDLSASTGGKLHWSMSNWTKVFWIGGEPQQQIDIDNNLAYLESTRYIPNFDPNLSVSWSAIEAGYRQWLARPNDLYDGSWNKQGIWQTGMATAGSRPDIAPYPQWTVMWLYSGDWRARQMALETANLASAWSVNLRESDPSRNLLRIDAPGTGTGIGHTIAITDRKTITLFRLDTLTYPYTKREDRVVVVGPVSQKWTFDGAHQPAPFYPQYILTGDPYYLNEMYMWAGFSAARYSVDVGNPKSRAPTGAEGSIADELRGAGWVIRNRAEAAFAAPDGAPEQTYFRYLTNDAIARWEGGFGIGGTVFDGSQVKVWGKTLGNSYSCNRGPVSCQPPALHNWESNGNPLKPETNSTVMYNEKQGIWRPGIAGSFTSPWMQYYVMYGLGRVNELGFAANALLSYTGKWLTDMIRTSGNPYVSAIYQLPVEKSGGGYFSSWAETLQVFTPEYLNEKLPPYFARNLVPDGRQVWGTPGLAYLVDGNATGAVESWGWWKSNIYGKISNLANDPRWAIVPRTDKYQLPPQPTDIPSSR